MGHQPPLRRAEVRFEFAGQLRAQTDVSGVADSTRYAMVYANGRLTGDARAMLVTRIQAQMLVAKGAKVGPGLDPRNLREPLAAYFILQDHVFDGRGLEVAGTLPGWVL